VDKKSLIIMKNLKVKFKIRYIGEQFPKEIIEYVEVESDSNKKETDQQIKYYYQTEIVRPEDSKIGQTYPYEILENTRLKHLEEFKLNELMSVSIDKLDRLEKCTTKEEKLRLIWMWVDHKRIGFNEFYVMINKL
jgi:hypothetical protein